MLKDGGSDFYEILEVDYDASRDAIRASYRRLRERYSGDDKRLVLIKEAWSVLSDDVSRKRYDKKIKVPERQLQRRRRSGAGRPLSRLSDTQTFDRAQEGSGQPLGKTEIIPVAPRKTDVSGRTSDTEILDTDQTSSPSGSIHRTEIIDTSNGSVEQPTPSPSTDELDTKVRDSKEMQTQAPEQLPSACLEVVDLGGESKKYSLTKEKTTIGRRCDNDIVLEDPYISRQHAFIISRDAKFYVVDNGSRNRVRVGGVEIPQRIEHPLGDGDTIEIEGRELTLRLGQGS